MQSEHRRTALFADPKLKEALAGRDYQLEEREDKDSELTELWLNDDGTVTLGKTDGPPVKSYEGKWSILDTATEADRPFRLRLDRTYESATPSTGKTDAGEVDYHVKREFWGNVGKIGDVVEVEGIMHGLDEAAEVDCEVGFFALLDAASADDGREGEKK